ncbi:Thioredoxin domain-containing protein 3 like protein, partial [Termitomyces sp. T112]
MSASSSPPQSQNTLHVEENALGLQHSQSTYPITRTVAIIKPHALPHRFEIEHRIQEASFEIVKERRMEFDTETDPDTLYELFGEDAASFSEGAVWVYVLERRRAVEVWATLMGNADPQVARADAPHSLRALFGNDLAQNAVMGSPDTPTAELQIASIFASSPPFPTTELPADDSDNFNYNSLDSITLAAPDDGHTHSTATNPSTAGGSRLSVSGKPA